MNITIVIIIIILNTTIVVIAVIMTSSMSSFGLFSTVNNLQQTRFYLFSYILAISDYFKPVFFRVCVRDLGPGSKTRPGHYSVNTSE